MASCCWIVQSFVTNLKVKCLVSMKDPRVPERSTANRTALTCSSCAHDLEVCRCDDDDDGGCYSHVFDASNRQPVETQ
jgi:hypothetical protein